MLTDYTAYDSVRTVLGLNNRELPDTALAAEIYTLMLETELEAVSPDLEADYLIAAGETTASAKTFVRALRVFATHCVALKCAEALPMFSSKAITDGKAGVYRDGNSPYTPTMAKIAEAYYVSRRGVQEAYSLYGGVALSEQTPVTLGGVSLTTGDPVTGA